MKLPTALGYDLWALTQQGPAEELNKTWQTQPALLDRLRGAVPRLATAGRQSASAAGGSQPRRILRAGMRGCYRVSLTPFAWLSCVVNSCRKPYRKVRGAMSAIIGLDDAAIAKACEESAEGQVVSPVNYNSPGQVVIAGHKEAVERAGAACKAAGAKRALPLPVSVPSHCALMKPAAEKLAVELQKITFNAPTISGGE